MGMFGPDNPMNPLNPGNPGSPLNPLHNGGGNTHTIVHHSSSGGLNPTVGIVLFVLIFVLAFGIPLLLSKNSD